MRLDRPLDDLFPSGSHVKVLRALAAVPEGIGFSTREVARRAGISHPTASNVLERLRRQGIVAVRRTPWADEFAVNPEHVLWKRIRPLLRWDRRARDEVVRALADGIGRHAPWVKAAWLFGSAAREEMQPDSDLDVALIVPKALIARTKEAMEALAEEASLAFGNRLNSLIGSRPIEQLIKSGSPGYRLWRDIAREGIPLIAPEGG